jgi:hypothetical protein
LIAYIQYREFTQSDICEGKRHKTGRRANQKRRRGGRVMKRKKQGEWNDYLGTVWFIVFTTQADAG